MRTPACFVVLCLGVAAAHAETPHEQADRLFAEGRKLLKQDPAAACEKFEAAIKLDPTATGTMLNLGLCYEHLGKYATSIRWFRKAQTAADAGELEADARAARQHIIALAEKVPTLNLSLQGVAEAELRVDGRRLEPTEYARAELDPGSHEIVGIAPGKESVVLRVEIAAGERLPLTVAFPEDVVPVIVDRGRDRKRAAMWVGAGGLGLYAVTLGYGLYLRGEQQAANDAGDPERYDKATERLEYIDTGLFIAGTVAIAAAVGLYVTAPGREQRPDAAVLAPVITGDQLGMALSGRF